MRLFPALLIVLFLLAATPVRADYTSSYDKYRQSHADYEIAKSSYGTYKTLLAREDAIKQMRSVLKARDELMAAYFDLLAFRVPGSYKDTFSKIKDSEKSWLADHSRKVDAAASLEDLNDASSEFQTRYPQMDAETKLALVTLLVDKQTILFSRWDTLAASVTENVDRISREGEDVGPGERGIVSARNKKELAVTKAGQASKAATDLLVAQQRLTESKQYLREATNYLNEILRAITGQ